MKQIFYVVVALFMYTQVNSQTLEETSDYLEYIIEENPPFQGMSTEFKVVNTSDGDRFTYVIELREGDKILNSKTSLVYLSEIKNIILDVANYEGHVKYQLRIGLKADKLNSFAVAYGNSMNAVPIDELVIALPNNEVLANKIKSALMHLFKLKNLKVSDLNMF
ncbi:hypothetical protein [Leeuwenhoekiella nanhaiensis]|uniref:Uncharacterized protein n=1 Tax=Leeuwenhoekiella nanhaiensis TaxID=1655491 RepID=A0A2G1VVW1_9FLAO|nr:hypothetical protein [Leeuwenhoekiella nanhaiensis]PHQ30894.1 hypothetical protein CJ305_01315 [Leeuwenhoekiella nanhaiensis]